MLSVTIAIEINYEDSLKNSSHKSKSQFCKVGEFLRQSVGSTRVLMDRVMKGTKNTIYKSPIINIAVSTLRLFSRERCCHIMETCIRGSPIGHIILMKKFRKGIPDGTA